MYFSIRQDSNGKLSSLLSDADYLITEFDKLFAYLEYSSDPNDGTLTFLRGCKIRMKGRNG